MRLEQRLDARAHRVAFLNDGAAYFAAFDAGKEVADKMLQERWTDWTPFSFPFNLTQQPAASVPCGFTNSGLPAGLHLIGRMFDDTKQFGKSPRGPAGFIDAANDLVGRIGQIVEQTGMLIFHVDSLS
mgnify:CR=1 FL=1